MSSQPPFDSDGTPEKLLSESVPTQSTNNSANVGDTSLHLVSSEATRSVDDTKDASHRYEKLAKEREQHEVACTDDEFAIFFEKYQREAFSYIFNIVGDWHDAQDIWLETFFAASQSWSQIRGLEEKPQRRWLYVT